MTFLETLSLMVVNVQSNVQNVQKKAFLHETLSLVKSSTNFAFTPTTITVGMRIYFYIILQANIILLKVTMYSISIAQVRRMNCGRHPDWHTSVEIRLELHFKNRMVAPQLYASAHQSSVNFHPCLYRLIFSDCNTNHLKLNISKTKDCTGQQYLKKMDVAAKKLKMAQI